MKILCDAKKTRPRDLARANARYSEKQSHDEGTSAETRNLSPVCKWIEIIFYNRRKVQQPEVADKQGRKSFMSNFMCALEKLPGRGDRELQFLLLLNNFRSCVSRIAIRQGEVLNFKLTRGHSEIHREDIDIRAVSYLVYNLFPRARVATHIPLPPNISGASDYIERLSCLSKIFPA